MSQEPPRVVQSEQFESPIRSRPKSNVGRYLVFAAVSLVTLIFMCSGAAFYSYRKFNADSNFGGSYSDLREPIGGGTKSETREQLANAPIAKGAEAEQIAAAMENYSIEVDVDRFVMEMQRSGKSGGAVNPLTRPLWVASLVEAVSEPVFGDFNAVLHFEWIVPDVEARAVVACLSQYDTHSVYVLYLKRSGETWKLFDWRDVLAPMNESQYWAIYTLLPEPMDDSYSDFSNDAYEISMQYEVPAQQRIQQLMTRYRQVKFPRQYVHLAKDHLCAHLVNLHAKEELAAITATMKSEDFLGALIYKATAAEWAGDTAKAFDYLSELNTKLGWHPQLASLAGSYAKTPEQKKLATQWLQRSVLLAPTHAPSVERFFALGNATQCELFMQKLAETENPSESLLEIVGAMPYTDELQLSWLLKETESVEKFLEAKECLVLVQRKL